MNKQKHTGSYYTPSYLAEFIMSYVSGYFIEADSIRILEPSVGDGSFIRAYNQTIFPDNIIHFSFDAIEKTNQALEKAKESAFASNNHHTRFSFTNMDFLEYQKEKKSKYSLIAGNPPYIKKSLLIKSQIKVCAEINIAASLSDASVKNIWPTFLIRCTQLLAENGILAFVLPAELLQVNFSAELRTYLSANFERLEIFTFDDLLFECKGQDTILLFGFKKHVQKGQFFTHITDTNQLLTSNFILKQNIALTATDTKWTHHTVSSDELTFINNIGKRLNNINHYCESKPGIVTAANNFFIIDQATEKRYRLGKYARPIIQKGHFVNGSVVFEQKEYDQLVVEGKPSKVLCFSDEITTRSYQSISEYLNIGIEKKIPLGYKCAKRKNWFVIPNVAVAPEGFFFRRVHHYPKFLVNNAAVLVTDTAYKVDMRHGFVINHLVYSFYNSLTLTFAELNGRYYGGGVLELTPQEFKKLPVPYVEISNESFNQFRQSFEKKLIIEDVLEGYDSHILNSTLGLCTEDIMKVQSIRKKLVVKRFKN